MRTPVLTLSAILLLAAPGNAQTVLVEENFDTYVTGSLIAQTIGAPWATWGGVAGSNEEATISSEQAASGANSGKWESSLIGGGPIDMVVRLGDQTTGAWDIDFKMYIPAGKGGYFNLLHQFGGITNAWAVEVSFPMNGNIECQLQGTSTVVGTYEHDAWFDVHVFIDLDADVAELSVNDALLRTWPFSWDAGATTGNMLQLGGLNFFAYAGGTDLATYYIDDLRVATAVGAGIAERTGDGVVGLFPNPAKEQATAVVRMPHGGPLALEVLDMTGRVLASEMLGHRAAGEQRVDVPVAGLTPGAYLLRAHMAGEQRTVRFVVR